MNLDGIGDVLNFINKARIAPQKAVENTCSDVASRGPGIISTSVTRVYNLQKKDVSKPKLQKDGKWRKQRGSVSIRGERLDSMAIAYRGRRLTPLKLMPQKRPKNPKNITAEIFKGKKKVLGSANTPPGKHPVFLIPAPRKMNHSGGDDQASSRMIAAIRVGRKILVPLSLSVPQAVLRPNVSEDWEPKLRAMIQRRLEHNLRRAGIG